MVQQEINFFSFAVFESLLSFFLNLYIMVFHVKSLRNGIKLTPINLIQLVMGATNISMRGTMLGGSIALAFSLDYAIRLYHITLIIVPFHLNFSYWLIAWLCTYYCTTITNIRHRIITWMKNGLRSYLPHLLLLSAVMSLILSVQSDWFVHIQISNNNSTIRNILPYFRFSITNLNLLIFTFLCTCLPFLIILGSLLVTMSSLFRHIWKVKKYNSSPNLQAHISAVRTMLLLLVLSITINIAEIVKLVAMSIFEDSVQLIIWLIVATFPMMEGAIIIQSSRKLKKMFLQRFCIGRCIGAIEDIRQ
uniref:Taste receptor type 2 n=1 Tax=Pyxicephalus adspersus TaxID=30357 RepID=A0AAV2ZQL5_PYXAD|nr:TPA: hypothetical protein GDO54_014775 [Pyxicephalus adspersus]